MAATDRDLGKFREYLEEFGLSDGTLDTYLAVTKRAMEEGGWIPRLKGDLAPKSKRLVRAAARHWADWKGDGALREALKRLRLPAPRRKSAKVPLSLEEHRQILRQTSRDTELGEAGQAVVVMMAYRGFRLGDVLRMRRVEIVSALSTGVLAFEAKGGRRLEFTVLSSFRPCLEVLVAQPKWSRVEDLVSPGAAPGKSRRKAASKKIQRALTRIATSLGIDGVYPHRLRRTYSVEYLRANKGDPEAIVKLVDQMQWASINTAMEYVNHSRAAERDRVAETLFDP